MVNTTFSVSLSLIGHLPLVLCLSYNAMAATDDAKVQAVKEQMEFYLSDSNLPTDKFMKKLVKEGNGCKLALFVDSSSP